MYSVALSTMSIKHISLPLKPFSIEGISRNDSYHMVKMLKNTDRL